MSVTTSLLPDTAPLPECGSVTPGGQEEPDVSPPAPPPARWIGLRTPPGGGAAIGMNMAATLGQWARSAGEEFRVGVLLPPFSAETGRYLNTYGPSMDAVLHDHLGLPPASSYGWGEENQDRSFVEDLLDALQNCLAAPGGLRDCVRTLAESSDDQVAALAVGERYGIAVVPGVCTSWPERLSPEAREALGQAMHERVARYLQSHCDLVLLPPRGRRDPDWVRDPECELEIVVEESSSEGAKRAASHPNARLGLLHGVDGHLTRVSPKEISAHAFAELCGRQPDAEASLNIYELMGGRGGGLLAGSSREAASRRAFMELTSELLAPLPGLEFLSTPLPPALPNPWRDTPAPRSALRRVLEALPQRRGARG